MWLPQKPKERGSPWEGQTVDDAAQSVTTGEIGGFREKIKTKEEEGEYKRNAPHASADYPVAVTAESFNF